MTEDDIVTTQERYIRATQAGNLDVEERTRGPADYLIAAGWAGTAMDSSGELPEYIRTSRRLAAALMRLIGEYDVVKGELDLARRYISPSRKLAEKEYASLWRGKVRFHGPTRELRYLDAAEQEELEVLAAAHSFAMLQLKSLSETRDVLHRWAEIEATRRSYMVSDKEISVLIGRILDVFIDPNCYKCGGRGVFGAHGAPQRICPTCAGVGKRRGHKDGKEATLGRTQAQNLFCGHVLSQMDMMVDFAKGKMDAFLRERG